MKSENKVCFEEEVFLEEIGKSYKYTFSNDPSDIQKVIEKQTGYLVPVNDTEWRMNPGLSQNLQKTMKDKNVDFCTTTFVEGDERFIYLNRRCGNTFSIIIIAEDITPLEKIASGVFGRRAEKHMESSEYSKAIVASSQALKLEPDSPGALSVRAWAYYNKGEFDLALADYSQAIAINPEAANLYALRARVFNAKNQNEQTLKDLLKAFDLDPDGMGKRLFDKLGIRNYNRSVITELLNSLRKQK
jgi:tetratricopeptide (TPR) repeat protein